MASGISPSEPSRKPKELIIPQSTWRYPDLPDIVVTYNSNTNGKFVSQLKSPILRLSQKINIGVSLGLKVKNATIDAMRIKSLTGKTHKVALDQNGGRYETKLFTVISTFSSRT